jgi:hypothetical protein
MIDTDDDNFVPEITAANPDGGAERLDADPISQSLSDSIDQALDEAEGITPDKTEDNSSAYQRNIQKQEPETQQDEDIKFGTNFQTNTEKQQPEIDPEIAAIPMPPNMSEKQQSNWRKLAEAASVAKKQAAEAEILRQKLAETQQQAPPDYDELRRFRATFDLKNDPGFKEKYDTPLKQSAEGIYSLLRKHKASDEVIKSIEDAGGPGKVSKAWWKRNAIDRLAATDDGYVDARRLENALLQIDDIESAREKDLEMSTQNQEAWIQQRQAEQQQQLQEESKQVYGYVENLTKDAPWARFQEIPPGATQEQIERIQSHNAGVKDLEEKFNSALYPKTSSERAAIAAAATLSHVVTNQLRYEQSSRVKLQQQIAQLTKELNSIKASGKMPRSSVSGQTPSKSGSVNDRIKMSASDAIDMGLDEAGA